MFCQSGYVGEYKQGTRRVIFGGGKRFEQKSKVTVVGTSWGNAGSREAEAKTRPKKQFFFALIFAVQTQRRPWVDSNLLGGLHGRLYLPDMSWPLFRFPNSTQPNPTTIRYVQRRGEFQVQDQILLHVIFLKLKNFHENGFRLFCK